MDNLISKLGDNPRAETLITGAYEAHNLYNGTIKANTSKEFTLREWVDYDVTKEQGMNKTVTNKINVIARPDLEVNELAAIKTTFDEPKLKANTTGIEIPKEENTIASVTNDETYPFSYNEETKKYTSTNKEGWTTSSIIFKLEQMGDAKICYEVYSKVDAGNANFYVRGKQIETVSGEKTGCITLKDIEPNEEIKVEYAKRGYSSSGKDGVTFSIEALQINKLPIKYCVSDKNICDPNKDSNIINNEIMINLNSNPKEQLVCTKLNNDKTYCNKKDKSSPILANNWFSKQSTENAITKPDVESITTLDKINIPSNAIKLWDASLYNNETVMAYYLDEDNNGKYELYIAGEGQVVAPTDSARLFSDESRDNRFTNVTTIDLSKLNTSKVTDMSEMFYDMNHVTSLDLSSFDTSHVTNMYSMFAMRKLSSLDISSFNTSKVTDMSWMFSFTDFTSLDLSNFDTSSVTDMSGMFYFMQNLTSLNLSSFDTSNVTNMYWMFADVDGLTTLDVSSFDTSSVTDMSGMFYRMNSITSLDLSNFDTSNVTDMSEMFRELNSLTSLDVSNFDTRNVESMCWMFKDVSSLTSLDLSSFNTSNLWDTETMFVGMDSLTSLNISNFDTREIDDMYALFRGLTSLTSLDVSSFDTSNVTDMAYMFNKMTSITSLDLSNFDTTNVTNMNGMFSDMTNLTYLDLSSFDFSKVTSYSDMFKSSSKINTIKVKDETARDFIEARLTDASLTGVTVTIG